MKLRGITKGVGGSAVEGVAGVIAFYAHRMLSTKVAAVQNHPLIAPAGILVLGHVMKKSRKLNGVGTALCGIAGYAGAQVFELQKATTQANTPAAGTSGFEDYDTGALTQPGDIGALTQASDIGEMYAPTAGSAYSDAYGL
jgi:hypothetical protein